MNANVISFLSTRGRKMNIDLKIVQDYLASVLPDITFEYYFKNTATKVPAVNQQLEKARLSFCETAKNLLCMDASIPIRIAPAAPEERRLLTLAPYDYLFKEYLNYIKNPESEHKKTFIRCTHVIPGAPFFSRFLKDFYVFENTVILDDLCLPFSWDITQESQKTQFRNTFEYFYPQAKGKKILSVITVNQKATDEMDDLFCDFDLTKLLDQLKNEWFLITNNVNLLEMAASLSFRYADYFGYMKDRFNVNNLLYFSDILVTNSSKHACAFASAKKPVYYLNYGSKYFGTYIKQFYPALYLNTAGELMKINYEKPLLSEEQQKFCQDFSYNTANTASNPLEVIRSLYTE